MTKAALDVARRRTIEIIEALGFGVIENLTVRDGVPCLEPEPRIVQTIKLDSQSDQEHVDRGAELTLKKEFEGFFARLEQLQDGVVSLEVRHGVPVRLVIERKVRTLLP